MFPHRYFPAGFYPSRYYPPAVGVVAGKGKGSGARPDQARRAIILAMVQQEERSAVDAEEARAAFSAAMLKARVARQSQEFERALEVKKWHSIWSIIAAEEL